MHTGFLVVIDKNLQRALIEKAIEKAGSERKLENELGISNSSIYDYKKNISKPPLDRFERLADFVGLELKDLPFDLIDPTIYRKKGGLLTYKKHIKENRFEAIHKKMRQASSRKLKQWHKTMKKEHEEEYYKVQYNRFKKVSEYKLETKKGHFVRNKLEQDVANALFNLGVNYYYEQYVKADGTSFFPDFLVGKTIIECTMWRGRQKAIILKKKIKKLEKEGFLTKVVIPPTLKNFYKPIEKNVISISELKTLFMPG